MQKCDVDYVGNQSLNIAYGSGLGPNSNYFEHINIKKT